MMAMLRVHHSARVLQAHSGRLAGAPARRFFSTAEHVRNFPSTRRDAAFTQDAGMEGTPPVYGQPAPHPTEQSPRYQSHPAPARFIPEVVRDQTLIISDRETARYIVNRMMLYLGTETIWACDTEVADIDLKTVGPVGNGKVVCASVYGGPEVDFGKYGKDKILWIDNAGDAEGVLEEFHDWFLREEAYKVWHNYGFDRHVMYNEGIDCRGFRGDTMHMARLLDSSRDKAVGGGEGYSLASLSADYLGDSKLAKTSMKEIFGVGKLRKDGQESKVKELPNIRDIQLNPDKRDLWIEYSVKDALVTWNLHEVLREQLEEKKWIAMDKKQGNMYDFYIKYLRKFGKILTDMEREGIRIDTQVHLREAETKARAERARLEQVFLNWAAKYVGEEHAKHLNVASTPQIGYFLFGTKEKDESGKLVNVKEKVFKVDKSDEEYAAEVQSMEARNPYAGLTISNMNAMLKERGLKRGTATKAQLMMKLLASDEVQRLKTEALERCADAGLPLDDAPTPRSALSDSMSNDRDCDEDRDLQDMLIARGQFHNGAVQPVTDTMSSADEVTSEAGPGSDDALVEGDGEGEENGRKSRKLKKAKVDKRTAVEIEAEEDAARYLVNMDMIEAIVNSSEKPKRQREVRLKPLLIPPVDLTPKGTPQVSTAVLRKLAGKEVFGPEEAAQWGLAFDFFGKQEKGKEACRALAALADIGQIDTTITNFLVPLQYLVDKNSRIHCSMNLNTETGRLSARRPNLQNQPALEKDQYKIRDAFVAEEGNTLIVADYGQLELRILAHIANCKSMIEAFSSGGCFHSRTAVGMYDHIKQSIADGECILEWDYSKGEKPDVPLVKDKFGSERRKAKTLNFSIAYGKTVHGLAKDWGISTEDAQKTLEAWYRDRPEVKAWQDKMRHQAMSEGYVSTIMGRSRILKNAQIDMICSRERRRPTSLERRAVGHSLRAAINTPIQGSAADVVMMAMIVLNESEVLRNLGWRMLLQIHDEVILEGPKDTRDEALAEVRRCMENPFDGVGLSELRVSLDVDAKSADSWYQAK